MSARDPLPQVEAYQGVKSVNPANVIVANRAPTANDKKYPIGTLWIYKVANTSWQCTSAPGVWTAIGTGATGGVITVTGDAGGHLSPVGGDIIIAGTAAQGVTTAGAGHTITITNTDWTTAQKGVGILSSNAQAIAGAGTTQAVTPAALAAKLGTQTAHGVLIGEGTAAAVVATAVGTNGQVLTGNTGADPTWGGIGIRSGLTAHGVVVAEGASAFAAAAVGTSGQFLVGATGADPAFATIGGLTGLAATLGANSYSLSVAANYLREVMVTVTSGQLLALRATPKVLLATPGVGLSYEIVSAKARYIYNTTPYTINAPGDDMVIRWTNTTGSILTTDITSTNFIDQAASTQQTCVQLGGVIDTDANATNAAVVLHNEGGAEYSAGDGTLEIYLTYRIHTIV